MTKNVAMLLLAGVVMAAFVGAAYAGDEGTGQTIPPERQAKLMAKFGDRGIDANEDGVLTRDEVHAFFAEMHGNGMKPGCGGQGKGGPGLAGFGPCGGQGPGATVHHVGMALTYLDVLSQDAPPDGFNATTHPYVDTDGDGQLSNDEWKAFAEKKRNGIVEMILTQHPELDKDGDKTLNDEELDAVHVMFRSQLVVLHPEADTDKDGTLTEEEFVVFRDAHIEAMRTEMLKSHSEADLDKDGKLSDGEMHAFMEKCQSGGLFGCCVGGKGCQGVGCQGVCCQGTGCQGRDGCKAKGCDGKCKVGCQGMTKGCTPGCLMNKPEGGQS